MSANVLQTARRAARAATALGRIFLLRQRVPLFVAWNVTFRCNLRCRYCGACDVHQEDLDTAGVLRGLDELWALGARWITFGGGEPLLRPDMGEIMTHARKLGFEPFLSTNGWLIPRRMDVVRLASHVNLSLDGPRAVHDEVRGAGAFDHTLDAARACRDAGVPVSFQCTLSSVNLQSVDDMVALAESMDVPVMFQPATAWLDSSAQPNPIAPERDAYRNAINRLIELKRGGRPVSNSVAGLRHLARWPENARIWCGAGRITVEVEPDGRLLACHQCEFARTAAEHRGGANASITEQFARTPALPGCAQCWCGPLVELAMLFSMQPGAVFGVLRRFVE